MHRKIALESRFYALLTSPEPGKEQPLEFALKFGSIEPDFSCSLGAEAGGFVVGRGVSV